MQLAQPNAGAISEQELRQQLREAQDARQLANERARQAKEVAANANTLMCEARTKAERLKAELDTDQRSATEKHSRAISEALRAGSPPPADPNAHRDLKRPPDPCVGRPA